jgi:uncharacterized protein (TIGR02266 family)
MRRRGGLRFSPLKYAFRRKHMSGQFGLGLNEESEVSINNRRSQERKRVRVAVSMSSDSNFYVGFADNMSEGGLFVATHELLPIGDTIDLEFKLSDDQSPVVASAEVCWHRAVTDTTIDVLPGFGARFLDLDEGDRERLESFLEDREPIFHPE